MTREHIKVWARGVLILWKLIWYKANKEDMEKKKSTIRKEDKVNKVREIRVEKESPIKSKTWVLFGCESHLVNATMTITDVSFSMHKVHEKE